MDNKVVDLGLGIYELCEISGCTPAGSLEAIAIAVSKTICVTNRDGADKALEVCVDYLNFAIPMIVKDYIKEYGIV